jgi:hypothetical protein
MLKPTDKVSARLMSKLPGCNASERRASLDKDGWNTGGRAAQVSAKTEWSIATGWSDVTHQRGIGGDTVTRTRWKLEKS